MKRLFLILCSIGIAVINSNAQNVEFEIRDGIYDNALKTKIETNVSNLLSEINRAQSDNDDLNFSKIGITDEAMKSITMLWDNVPFFCEDELVIESVLTRPNGYQVRNIPLELKPEQASSDDYQEAVIDFNQEGTIESFYFALNVNLYRAVMKESAEVEDLSRRQQILDYVEHFRTAYNQKDTAFLQQVFSDDAIIITGRVTRTKPTDFNPLPKDKIIYNSQGKVEYLSRLKKVFDNNRYIKVNFSEIKVQKHPTIENFYGVLLHQGYESSTYSDDGYVFLLWDFTDEEHPEIHVRTWQPYFMDKERSKVITDDEVFTIKSFNIDLL